MAETVERVSPVASFTGPIYLLLFPIPVVCFVGALITDFVYSSTAVIEWLAFSEWLLAAGLFFGLFAAIALLIEFIGNDPVRVTVGWAHLFLFYAALLVELVNSFHHTIDGWTAVVPTGLILSIIGSLLALGAVVTLFWLPVTWVVTREARR
jgi:uncharacterized membrane protein